MNIAPRCRNQTVQKEDRSPVLLRGKVAARSASDEISEEKAPSTSEWTDTLPKPQINWLPTANAAACIFLLPSFLYIPEDNGILRFVHSFWTSWLRMSPFVVAAVVGPVTFWIAPYLLRERSNGKKDSSRCQTASHGRYSWHPACVLIILALAIVIVVGSTGPLEVLYPSWAWFPFIWGRYRVYNPHELAPALQPLCVSNSSAAVTSATTREDRLCLSRKSWNILSAGHLSSRRRSDVENVLKGVQFATNKSGGLVIGILSRDTLDAIEPLRQNVEALAKFFPEKLSIVVFENDSVDGTREAFEQWSRATVGYRVDLMGCGADNPNCKLKEADRHDSSKNADDFFRRPSAGKLPKFRQQLLEHVLEDPLLKNYSHMMVMDLDLAVSISPLGLLHSLGLMPDQPIASSGRTPIAGSLGTMVLPYDTVAMRFARTSANQRILNFHRGWCEMASPGDRWRFECPNTSPFSLMLTVDATATGTEPYKMRSAFNGAILYPLELIRKTKAYYHTGKDGQSCEHVGFHESLKTPVYVNPKWSFQIDPRNPGGPTGFRGLNSTLRVLFFHRLSHILTCLVYFGIFIFSSCFMVLVLNFFYPLVHAVLRRLDTSNRQELPLLVRKHFLVTHSERTKALH